MTLFEFVVPLVALGVAGVGILILRYQGQRLDRLSRQQPPPPAE